MRGTDLGLAPSMLLGRRLLANRLVQFLFVGAALYLLESRRSDERRVELEPATLEALRDAQAKKIGVASLAEDGRREVDARAIEDEILYREALRLGLDKDDPIIRERLVQKLLLLVEDMGGASRDPNDVELRAYFEANRARYRTPARMHFIHVFATRAEGLPDESELEANAVAGEPFPYAREMTKGRDEIARLFGAAFADGVTRLAPSEVSVPLRSTFGWHRVKLLERSLGEPATFEDVRASLLLDFMLDRRERVVGTYLVETSKRYEVRIGGAPVHDFVPTRRVAARTEGSFED